MGLIKTLLFHFLLSIRRPILGLSKLFAFMFLGCFAGIMLISELHQTPMTAKVMILSIGIIFTAINWFYDYLILSMQPDNMRISLFR